MTLAVGNRAAEGPAIVSDEVKPPHLERATQQRCEPCMRLDQALARPRRSKREHHLSGEKCLRYQFGGTAFYSPKASQAVKSLTVEPVLGPLSAEMVVQELNFSVHHLSGRGHIRIRLP